MFSTGSLFDTQADRYTFATNGTTIQAGVNLLVGAPQVVLLGTTETNAIIAACNTSYFSISSATALNSFFSALGGDSGGATVDTSMDIGAQFALSPGMSASFVFYQSIATNQMGAEAAVAAQYSAKPPIVFLASIVTNGMVELRLGTLDGSALTPDRAARIQFHKSAALIPGGTNWIPVAEQAVLTNGWLRVRTYTPTNSPNQFFRAMETP
jgi:hypothetical protein